MTINSNNALPQLTLTLKLLSIGKLCDKNLKLLKDSELNEAVQPVDVISIISQRSLISGQSDATIDQWRDLIKNTTTYVEKASYTNDSDKEKTIESCKQLEMFVANQIKQLESKQIYGTLRNIYMELDSVFSYLVSKPLYLQLAHSYDQLVESGVTISVPKEIMCSIQAPKFGVELFTFDFQKRGEDFETHDCLLQVMLKMQKLNIDYLHNYKLDLTELEDVITDILMLKHKIKNFDKSADQLLKFLDFYMKFFEHQSDIFFKKKVPALSSDKFFPKDILTFKKLVQPKTMEEIKHMVEYVGPELTKINSDKRPYFVSQLHISKLKDLAQKMYSLIGDDEMVRAFHLELLKKIEDEMLPMKISYIREQIANPNAEKYISHAKPFIYLPLDLIGPDIFQLSLPTSNESVYCNAITPNLIRKLQKEIDKSIKVQKKRNPQYVESLKDIDFIHDESKNAIPSKEASQPISNPITSVNLVEELHKLNAPKLKLKKPSFEPKKKKKIIVDTPVKQENVILTSKIYQEDSTKQSPYSKWLSELTFEKFRAVRRHVEHFLERPKVRKPLVDNIFELKIGQYGGLRVYFTYNTLNEIIFLTGGDKSTQKRDIETAKAYAKQYKAMEKAPTAD
ncbi:MAG: type II toxin-antitoxin system RelE/ParE family toxin [Parachlamydiales bacterium]|nr:type II toxin-antitoxin system RelE/ParE family toxin [Parachlamydiales bacterium]